MLETYGMKECKPVYTVGVGPELSINQGEGNLSIKTHAQRYQSLVGSVMYLAHVSRYDILYSVNHISRALANPSKAHISWGQRIYSGTSPAASTSTSPTKEGAAS